MNKHSLIGLSLLGLIPISTNLSAEYGQTEEPVMIVTAARSEQAAAASLTAISVIDRAQIERSQAPDLHELLRLEAGVDVARTGGPGGQTSVFLRGSNSNHVLIVIDGIRVAASGTGAFAWENLDLAIIERIEIVRGPRAARWGSDAIGGVIQIFTRRAQGATVRAGYGRYRDRSLAGSIGSGQAGLTMAARRVGGYSSQNERGFAFDPDDDGFELFSLAGNGSADLGPGQLTWNARLASGEAEFDQGESDVENYAAGVEYRLNELGPWQWMFNAAAYRDRLETATAFGQNEAITRRVQGGAQAQRLLGEGQRLIIGADGWRESGISRQQWAEQRNNIGLWAGLDGRQGNFDHELSLRVDRDSNFGSAVTGSVAGGWRPHADWQLMASLGRAFRAPSFSQLYSPGFGGLFAGNPDLDPETSLSGEIGLRWSGLEGQQLGLALFETRIDDLIDFAGADFQAINIRSSRIRGAEIWHQYSSRQWRSRAQATWQNSEDRDSGLTLLRRPTYKASLSVDRLLGAASWVGGELVHIGSRVDVGRQQLPGYTLLNLRAGRQLAAGFRLEGRLENIGDRVYEHLIGFNTHGRSLFLALSWEG
jgi:vitamin B12 transporter